ncbi:MAG TPA: putative capsular polysaccharide synthesis family protein [Pyrinomonadaceae bacterium]|nr:putative capsular polysaccharide synthesis family protein [Pyrinomonadaceae bacterium]
MSLASLRNISRLVGYRKVLAALSPRLPPRLGLALARLHFRRSVRRAAGGPTPPVLVYTAPKVASTAVTVALQAAGQSVFHVHMISADSMRRLAESMRRRGLNRMKRDALGLPDIGKALASELIGPRHPARIVSLVRDPVARNISFYFETLDILWQTERAYEHVGVERLLAEYHERFGHERGVDWFDNEFKPVLGIDVYDHPFPRDKGYQRIDSGPYEVLIMRHDLDDRVKERCLAELVGVGSVSLKPANVGAQKPYADVYREFLRRVELPEDYVERMLGSKYARHFYGPEELARFRARWLKGGPAGRSARVPSVSLAGGAD